LGRELKRRNLSRARCVEPTHRHALTHNGEGREYKSIQDECYRTDIGHVFSRKVCLIGGDVMYVCKNCEAAAAVKPCKSIVTN
jgi:hypothetical protein